MVFCMFQLLPHSLQHLFGIVASVLHLGNVEFGSDSKDRALLENKTQLNWVSNVRQEEKSVFVLKRLLCAESVPFPHSCLEWMPSAFRRD